MEEYFDSLQMLKNMASLISRLLGATAEVVIHDIRSGEIVWIANGELTGREKGKTADRLAIRFFAEQAGQMDENSCIVGYLSTNKGVRPLKSSTLFVHNSAGALRYALCINQDISQFKQMQNFLNVFIGTTAPENIMELSNQTFEDMAAQIILEEAARLTPYAKGTKEEKMDIIRRLYEKDIFEVRKVKPKVCSMLHISQATLYNYLRELRGENGSIKT